MESVKKTSSTSDLDRRSKLTWVPLRLRGRQENMAYSLPVDLSKKNFHMTISDEEFSCPLCFEILEEPKSLPNCAHNFCKMCIHQMLIRNNNSDISCPVCRKPSHVPTNGADGFPTNTFLVRLMDNIPGRNEKRELLKAVATCKDEIERNRKVRDDIEKSCCVINRNKELAQELKSQVSEYANEMIECIKNSEQKLCREIDDILRQKCGLQSENSLYKTKKMIEGVLEQASNCVYSVEDILGKDDLSEILDMKTVMVEQLAEYSKFPPVIGVANEEISAFDLQLEKNSNARENPLGKVVSRVSGRGSDSARVETEQGLSQSFFEIEEESSPSSYTSHTSSDDQESVVARPDDWATPNHPPGFTQSEIVASVSLPFEPFSIAVSPHSGDIALLCKENNKVYLYKANGSHYGTINIRYGNLWDVGFSIDDNIIVVNRRNNRLLFYTKDNQFTSQEKEIPRTGLKYTYLSVCEDGRLIVTSARTDDDDNDNSDDDGDGEIVQCIIIYDADDNSHKRMFGRKHLEKPVSRAVCHNGSYYIADYDSSSHIIYFKVFSSQGQFIGCVGDTNQILYVSASLSKDIDFNRLIMGKTHPISKWVQYIVQPQSFERSEHNCPHDLLIHKQEVLPKSFHWQRYEGILKIEIYRDQEMFNIVHYH